MIRHPQPAKTVVGGFLNIDKESDWTSTDVVRKVKSLTRVKKIGHGGTLDPIATGVLPLCLGPATRFADSILLGTKAYRLTVTLGTATDTYDSEGETVAESDPSVIDRDAVDRALPAFRGTITQVPPMYSAVKHNGQRLYKLARAGVEVERKSRQVEVAHLEITRWAPPEFDLELVCGHGFYARSLANDLGEALGGAAHLSALQRTRAGKFDLAGTITIGALETALEKDEWQDFLFPVDWTLYHLRSVVLDPMMQEMCQNGRPIPLSRFGPSAKGEQVRAYSRGGEIIALLSCDPARGGWKPDKVLVPQ